MSSNDQTLNSSRFPLQDEANFSYQPVAHSTPSRSSHIPSYSNTVIPQKEDALSMFMVDYQETVLTLEQEISNYKRELQDLKTQVYNLVEDNQKLTQDLRESVEARMLAISDSFDNAEMEMLKKQVAKLTEAKESVLKMWNIALQEIERLEKELERSNLGTDITVLESRIKEIKREYDQAIASISLDLNSCRDELSSSKQTVLSLKKELEDSRNLNDELSTNLKAKEKEINEIQKKFLQCQNQSFQLEDNLMESKKGIESWEGRFKSLEEINEKLQQQIKALQLREIDLEASASESAQQAKESVKLAENAILEKDVAVFREHQAKKEIEGLQTAMDKIVDSASEKTRVVIENVKEKCDERINVMAEEIKDLEMESGKSQAYIERLGRDKKDLEEELSKLYLDQSGSANQALLDELTIKLTSAEIERDKALSDMKNLQYSLTRTQGTLRDNTNISNEEISQLRKQLLETQQSYKSNASERLELISQVAQLRKLNAAQEEENAVFRQKLKKDLNYFETVLREQQEEHKRHIQDRCHSHNDTIFELRSLVDAQQRIVRKWKEEAKKLTEKFECEITKVSSEMAPLKEERKRLKKDLEDADNRLAQFEEQMRNVTLENFRLSNKVQLFEHLNKVSSNGPDNDS